MAMQTENPIKDTETITMTKQELQALIREVYHKERAAENKGKKLLSTKEMYDLLKQLPAESSRTFEKTVTGYGVAWDDSVIKNEIYELIDVVKTQPEVSEEADKVAFAAFSVAVNYERRMKNSTAEEKLLRDYEPYFAKNHIFYNHMLLLSKMEKMENFRESEWDEASVRELMQIASDNADNMTDNVGGKHAFAETVALAFENVPQIMDSIQKTDKISWINRGRNAAEKAIQATPDYGKFYCTHGRLMAVTGDYDTALSLLNEAIDKEDNQRSDYAIRIGRYLTFIQQIRARKQMAAMEQDANNNLEQYRAALEEQEKETIVKNMEFLGLFSGIVSFTIGSLTISGAIAEQSIKHAAGLIVVLMGALMAVFATFGIILHGICSKKAMRNVVVLLLGAAVVVGGIVFCLN